MTVKIRCICHLEMFELTEDFVLDSSDWEGDIATAMYWVCQERSEKLEGERSALEIPASWKDLKGDNQDLARLDPKPRLSQSHPRFS